MSAQTLNGVLLGGTPDYPAIINKSDKKVIGWVLVKTNDSGTSVDMSRAVDARSLVRDTGIVPGGNNSFLVRADEILERAARAVHPGGTPVKVHSVVLDSVIFADGEFAGPDTANSFKLVALRLRVTKAFALASLSDPGKIETAAKALLFGRNLLTGAACGTPEEFISRVAADSTAEGLYQIQRESGVDAALQVAERLSRLPDLWRGGLQGQTAR